MTLTDRQYSVACGLCGHDYNSRLDIGRKHPVKPLEKVINKFTKELLVKVTEFEIETLKAFGLPEINEVRQQAKNNRTYTGNSVFRVTNDDLDKYTRVLSNFQSWLTGDSQLQTRDAGNPYIERLGVDAYKYMAPEDIRKIQQAADVDGMDVDEIMAKLEGIDQNFNNPYLRAAIVEGGEHIKTSLARTHWTAFRQKILEMAMDGTHPLQAAVQLHILIGEGAGWYYNRITKSEAALMANASFDYSARQSGARFERWSAAVGACPICAALDGHLWHVGQGPYPVTHTHPQCFCTRFPQFFARENDIVAPSWQRGNAYDEPWTADDIKNIQKWL